MICDAQKLVGFKIHATYARTSILEFNAILRNKEGVLAKSDEVTKDLGIDHDTVGSGSCSVTSLSETDSHEGKTHPSREVESRYETENISSLTV